MHKNSSLTFFTETNCHTLSQLNDQMTRHTLDEVEEAIEAASIDNISNLQLSITTQESKPEHSKSLTVFLEKFYRTLKILMLEN